MGFKKKLATGMTLVGATAITLHLINKAIYLSATIDNLLSSHSGSFYDWRFGKVFYSCKGKGKPILLIHDLTTFSSTYEWNKIVDELSETRTVYSIDLLGCGRSDKPNLTYTSFFYVEMITDFIKHVIGDKTDIIATGESGSFALAACNNDTSIIDQILLVNPAGINLLSKIPNKKSKLATLLINTPIIGTFIYNMLTRRRDIRALFELDYFNDIRNVDENLISTYYESAHSKNGSSKHLYASMVGYYTTINVSHCLESLTNSVFIITGDDEDSKIFAKEYKDILPSIELATIPHCKHLPHLEQPKDFIEQISIYMNTEAI